MKMKPVHYSSQTHISYRIYVYMITSHINPPTFITYNKQGFILVHLPSLFYNVQ